MCKRTAALSGLRGRGGARTQGRTERRADKCVGETARLVEYIYKGGLEVWTRSRAIYIEGNMLGVAASCVWDRRVGSERWGRVLGSLVAGFKLGRDFQGLDVREGRPKCWGRNIADFSVAMHGPTVRSGVCLSYSENWSTSKK